MAFGQEPAASEGKNLHVNLDLFVPKPGTRAKVCLALTIILRCFPYLKKPAWSTCIPLSMSTVCGSVQLLLHFLSF